MTKSRLGQIRKNRLEKREKLMELGINPYPARAVGGRSCAKAKKKLGKKVRVRGRLVSWRPHGKIIFADLADDSGKIQLYFQKDALGEKYSLLKFLDVGDFLSARGKVFKTKAGEVTVAVADFTLRAKSIRPLPAKWHGLKDVEARYRRRYLDLLMNPAVKDVFVKRSRIISRMRSFLDRRGFLEVETPTLQPIYGGAAARPFVTRYNALGRDFYLKISDELYLKRLVIGGLEKVYEIDHNFRNEGIDKTHNPEFTMMECYWAWADYKAMMRLTEEMIADIAKSVTGKTTVSFVGRKINLKPPWRRLTMFAAIEKYLGWDPEKISDPELEKKLRQKDKTIPGGYNRGLAIAALFEEVEPRLIQPTFITDFPQETTMLCKPKEGDGRLIERFEPYVAGWEIGNAYSELNDPVLQRECFAREEKMKKAGNEEAHPADEDFVAAMEHGMPPMGGLGIGIDRLVMLLTNQAKIRDVILFPTLKPKK